MSIHKRGNRYIVDYYPDGRNGKRARVKLPETVTDEEEAKSIEKALRAAAKGKKEEVSALIGATVNDVFPDYLAWYELHRAKRSHKDVGLVYEKHIKRFLGNEKIEGLNNNHIIVYEKLRKKEGVTNRTIMKELSYFSGFLKWCRRERGVDLKPIKIEKLPHQRPVPIVLSPEEVVRIVEASEPFYKAFFLCLYTLGLRYSEARFLKWDDIDYANGAVRVVQKGGTYKILPLNDWLESALKDLGPYERGKYVFANKRTGEPVYDVRKAILRACTKADVKKKVNPHLFRHSVATHFLGADVNLRTIQTYLGHSQVSTTEFYTHVSLAHLKKAATSVFGGLSTNKEVYPK